MRKKLSQLKVWEISALVAGVVSVFAVVVVMIVSQASPQFSNKITKTATAADAYDSELFVTLDSLDTDGDCVNDLGGTFDLTTATCTVNNPVALTNQFVVVTHGTTLRGNGNVTLDYTSTVSSMDFGPVAIQIVGLDDPLSAEVVVDGINVNGGDFIMNGAVLTGHNVTLSNSNITGAKNAGIVVAKHTDTFTLDGNDTSNNSFNFPSAAAKGVYVKYHAQNGTIINHTANNNASHGIELAGTHNVSVTYSQTNNNGGYGIYVHDFVYTIEYPDNEYVIAGELVPSTGTYIANNEMLGNTLGDIGVDVSDPNAWDPAQATATNNYGTAVIPQGTFPGNQGTIGDTGTFNVLLRDFQSSAPTPATGDIFLLIDDEVNCDPAVYDAFVDPNGCVVDHLLPSDVSGISVHNNVYTFEVVPGIYRALAISDVFIDDLGDSLRSYKNSSTEVVANDIAQVKLGFKRRDASNVGISMASNKFKGSELWVFEPAEIIWDGTTEVYPFIFESDSDWDVDICLEVPEGYSILDPEGCVQTLVANELKTINFVVEEVGSIPFGFIGKLKLKNPEGKIYKHEAKIETKLSKKLAKEKEKELKEKGYKVVDGKVKKII